METPPLVEGFIQDLTLRKHITERTADAYRYDLQIFFTYLVLRRLAPLPPSDWTAITVDHLRYVNYELIRDFLLQFESPVSSRHQQRKAAVLRSFFRYLVEVRELLDRNPTIRIHVGIDKAERRADLQQVKSLDEQQLHLFLTNVRTGVYLPTERARAYHERVRLRNIAIVTLFLTSGLRLSELASISLGDLDLVRSTVRVRRKGGFSDWVPLHPDAREAIHLYIERERRQPAGDAPARESPLFVATTTLERLTGRQIENLVKRYAVTADPRLEFVTPHKLRHTFAQRIYDATGDLYLTAVSLAHSHVESARIYAKVTEEQRSWAIGRIALEPRFRSSAQDIKEPGT